MNKIFFLTIVLLIIGWARPPEKNIDPIQKLIGALSADSIYRHITFLGSDSLEGRGTGSAGGELAAKYIADQLRNMSLTPLGSRGSYFQVIPMHSSVALSDSRLRLFTPHGIHDFELNRDYLLYKTGAQTFIPNPVSLVFVGYGIVAPEFDHNDYQSVDVEGKVVVFLSGEPPSPDSAYFAGMRSTVYSFPEAKQRIAISHGAVGSIMIPNPTDFPQRTWNNWQSDFAFGDVTLAYAVTGHLSLVMNSNSAETLFNGSPFTLTDIFKMDHEHTMRSFPLCRSISFKGEFIEKDFTASNVVGMLKGSDATLRDSYLILSAHYDHLGIGPAVEGDSIYNGVFDNAAGVGAVLEMARVLSQSPVRPKRSLIFLFTTGEEEGLLGSTYYLDHPPEPLYRTIADINVDGLAMFDAFNDIFGIGSELSSLRGDLRNAASASGVRLSPVPTVFKSLEPFYRSDQIAFAKAGVPSLLIIEGLDYQHLSDEEGMARVMNWFDNVYHSPFDDLKQPMNFSAALQHCQIILRLAIGLANSEDAPHWNPGAPYINARLQSVAEKR